MPDRLVLIRHGQSQGNVANEAARKGDKSHFTPAFREFPGRNWELTEEGREQARVAGEWVMEHIAPQFDRYYVSPYVRAMQTAALLDLPDAQWMVDQRLRERDYGDISSMPRDEFEAAYPESALIRRTDRPYWRTPGGESMPDVRVNRFRSFLDTLHREMGEGSVITVSHGEVMWPARAQLEYMLDDEFEAALTDPDQEIHNTQILEYTRLDPETGQRAPYLGWMRSINPMASVAVSAIEWKRITRQRFSNEELLAYAAAAPKLDLPLDAES